jgi:hypothetical protein
VPSCRVEQATKVARIDEAGADIAAVEAASSR